MKQTEVRVILGMVAAAVLFFASTSHAAGNVGDKAAGFSATTLEGKTVALSDYLGKKPVHLVFWATWCPNCAREIPAINALHAQFGDRLALLAINVGIDDSVNAARDYRKKHDMQYAVVFDKGNAISSRYGVTATPTQIVIGADGIIRYRGAGTPAVADIEKRWKALSANGIE